MTKEGEKDFVSEFLNISNTPFKSYDNTTKVPLISIGFMKISRFEELLRDMSNRSIDNE